MGVRPVCEALCIPRSSYYRNLEPKPVKGSKSGKHFRALSEQEKSKVLECLNSERFMDKAPAQVYATLLDEGVYLCSISTMYRILRENQQVRERRNQLQRPNYKKPELLATGPNQVWSWDITKLLGAVKWTYYYLYVILDIYSRYVVGWMVAHRESSELAKRLMEDAYRKQEVQPGQLTIHADRGSSMKSKTVAQLMADLGITKTHSRPHVSNDNPFSESQFKTMKYRPGFPERFGCIEDARSFSREFFQWYNWEHCHSGIGLLTPGSLHHGLDGMITQQRQEVLMDAYRANPHRFVRKSPSPPAIPDAVWINPPAGNLRGEGKEEAKIRR